jgi:hypothetical protein
MADMIGAREYGLMGAGATLILCVEASRAIDVVKESLKQR